VREKKTDAATIQRILKRVTGVDTNILMDGEAITIAASGPNSIPSSL
jgi:hypothetical protein